MKKVLCEGGVNTLNIYSVTLKGRSMLLGYGIFLGGSEEDPEGEGVGRRHNPLGR